MLGRIVRHDRCWPLVVSLCFSVERRWWVLCFCLAHGWGCWVRRGCRSPFPNAGLFLSRARLLFWKDGRGGGGGGVVLLGRLRCAGARFERYFIRSWCARSSREYKARHPRFSIRAIVVATNAWRYSCTRMYVLMWYTVLSNSKCMFQGRVMFFFVFLF